MKKATLLFFLTVFNFITLFAQTPPQTAEYYLQYPNELIKLKAQVPFDTISYTVIAKQAQRWYNQQEDLVLAYSPIPDSLETFPDNYQLPITERNIDNEAITPFTWKWIHFEQQNSDSTTSFIALRRPNWWIEANNAGNIGNKVYLNIPETGIEGDATVIAVKPNQLDTRFITPNWQNQQTYRPITGFFRHVAPETWNYNFENEPDIIGATATHPFWSVTQSRWIAVGDLAIGEQVRTSTGNISKLISKEKRSGADTVYNIEVWRNHNYYVGEQGLLVHNLCEVDIFINKIQKLNLTKLSQKIEELGDLKQVFVKDFSLAKDETLVELEKLLNQDIDLVDHWKFNRESYTSRRYTAPIDKDINEVYNSLTDIREKQLVSDINNIPTPFTGENKESFVVAGGFYENFPEILTDYNFSLKAESNYIPTDNYLSMLGSEITPEIRIKAQYLNLIRKDYCIGGSLYKSVLNIDESVVTKITGAGQAASHAEVFVFNDLLKKMKNNNIPITDENLSKIHIYVKNRNNRNMCRCPNCFYIIGDNVKMIGNE